MKPHFFKYSVVLCGLGTMVATGCGSGGGGKGQLGQISEALSFGDDGGAGDASIDTGASDAALADGSQAAAIQAYIDQHFYATSDIEYSFFTQFGEQIDCIDFYAQHSVIAYQHMGVQFDLTKVPPPPPAPPGPAPNVDTTIAFNGQPDQFGNTMKCPANAVAVKRPSVAQILAMGGLSAYIQAKTAPGYMPYTSSCGTGSSCSDLFSCWEPDCNLYSSQPTISYEHAVGIQTDFDSSLYGSYTIMSIYSPSVHLNDHTVAQLWMQTGQCENLFNVVPNANNCDAENGASYQAVQSVEGGWISTNNSGTATGPQLFAFLTQDGYNSGCFAEGGGDCCPDPLTGEGTDCWVAYPGSVYTPFQDLSWNTLGTYPYELPLQVWQGAGDDPAYYGWYVWVNGDLMGWYPPQAYIWPVNNPGAGTYGPMAYGPATYFQIGGEVLDSWPSGKHTSTGMGTGYAPPYADGTTQEFYDAYHRDIVTMDNEGNYTDAALGFYNSPSCLLDHGVDGVCGYKSGKWGNGSSGDYGAYSLSTGDGEYEWNSFFYYGGGKDQCVGGATPPCP